MLFAQVAVAAYTCPQSSMQSAVVANDNAAPMANCDEMPAGQMDPAKPNLCKAHCESGQQMHEVNHSADLQSPALNDLWTLVWVLQRISHVVPVVSPLVDAPERPLGSPPLYLIHQVFRL
jgi:hypothetical protein